MRTREGEMGEQTQDEGHSEGRGDGAGTLEELRKMARSERKGTWGMTGAVGRVLQGSSAQAWGTGAAYLPRLALGLLG